MLNTLAVLCISTTRTKKLKNIWICFERFHIEKKIYVNDFILRNSRFVWQRCSLWTPEHSFSYNEQSLFSFNEQWLWTLTLTVWDHDSRACECEYTARVEQVLVLWSHKNVENSYIGRCGVTKINIRYNWSSFKAEKILISVVATNFRSTWW